MFSTIKKFLEDRRDQSLEDLKQFLRFESVSADSNCLEAMKQTAEFVRDRLDTAGLNAKIHPTAGHPIVTGEWRGAEGAPTVLVYGHYDVQPPDPLDLWTSPPFEPEVRDGKIFARGATDDKGQMLTHVLSVEAWLKTTGKIPVNVIFVIEGEEEVGSNNLELFLAEKKEEYACDIAVVSDTSMYAPDLPAITYGLRGILACEVTLTGPNRDLHSGVFGGAVANPINILTQMLGSLQDENGKVLIPGFYDDVLELSEDEKKQFAQLPFDEAAFMNDLGINAVQGEAGYSTTERRWARPTFDINGIFGGYSDEGPKTIIPSTATAKITCRLVPNQNAAQLTAALKSHLESICPASMTMEFADFHGCEGIFFDTSGPYFQAASQAIQHAFGTEPVFIREGGSIPVVATFQEIFGVETLLLGWGLNSDNLHSPNEHFLLDNFYRGTLASAKLWEELAPSQA